MNPEPLTAQLEREAHTFSGTFGVAAMRLDDGASFGLRADEVFPAASVVKLPMLVAALQLVERGRLRLDARHAMQAGDRAGGSGVLQVLDALLEPTLKDLLTLMIVVSDNTATNMVLDLLGGVGATNGLFAGMGLTATRVVGKLQVPWEQKTEAQRAGRLAELTPQETLGLLERLWRGELLSPELTALALEVLRQQQFTEIIARFLPEGTKTATKSGQIVGVRNDVGFVTPPDGRTYAVALASRGCRDERYSFENEAVLLLARASRLVYDHFTQAAG